jgi:hypothetical protein
MCSEHGMVNFLYNPFETFFVPINAVYAHDTCRNMPRSSCKVVVKIVW